MTTIAFRDGVLAADRLLVDHGERYGTTTKIGVAKDRDGTMVLFAGTGASSIAQRFRAWAAGGLANGDPPPAMVEANGDLCGYGFLFYEDGRLISYDPHQPPIECEMKRLNGTPIAAFGSGGQIALGAMAMGALPAKAVLVASEHDTNSGAGVDIVSFGMPSVSTHRP